MSDWQTVEKTSWREHGRVKKCRTLGDGSRLEYEDMCETQLWSYLIYTDSKAIVFDVGSYKRRYSVRTSPSEYKCLTHSIASIRQLVASSGMILIGSATVFSLRVGLRKATVRGVIGEEFIISWIAETGNGDPAQRRSNEEVLLRSTLTNRSG